MAKKTRKFARYTLSLASYLILISAILAGFILFNAYQDAQRDRAFYLLSQFQKSLMLSLRKVADLKEVWALPKERHKLNTMHSMGTFQQFKEEFIILNKANLKSKMHELNPLFAQLEEEIDKADRQFEQTGVYPSNNDLMEILSKIRAKLWNISGTSQWAFDNLMHKSFSSFYLEQLAVQMIEALKDQRILFHKSPHENIQNLYHENEKIHAIRVKSKEILSQDILPEHFHAHFNHMEKHFVTYSSLYPSFLEKPDEYKAPLLNVMGVLVKEFDDFFFNLSEYNTNTAKERQKLYLYKTIGLLLLFLFLAASFLYILYLIISKINRPIKKLQKGIDALSKGNEDALTACTLQVNEIGEMARSLESYRQQVNERLQNYEKRRQAKAKFFSKMNHELRTPVNAIVGYSEMLKEVSVELGAPEVSELATKILHAGNYLLNLSNSLLDLTYLESEQIVIHYDEINIEDFLKEIEMLVSPVVLANNNRFVFESGENLGCIISDRLKLKQIFLNLLHNAAKFTKNGTVTFKTTRDEQGIEFCISDTGRGIPSSQLENIFESFSKAHIEGEQGAGLGLSISKELCHILEGTISIESVEDKGTTVTVRFPNSNRRCMITI